jgi:hypothetical protein
MARRSSTAPTDAPTAAPQTKEDQMVIIASVGVVILIAGIAGAVYYLRFSKNGYAEIGQPVAPSYRDLQWCLGDFMLPVFRPCFSIVGETVCACVCSCARVRVCACARARVCMCACVGRHACGWVFCLDLVVTHSGRNDFTKDLNQNPTLSKHTTHYTQHTRHGTHQKWHMAHDTWHTVHGTRHDARHALCHGKKQKLHNNTTPHTTHNNQLHYTHNTQQHCAHNTQLHCGSHCRPGTRSPPVSSGDYRGGGRGGGGGGGDGRPSSRGRYEYNGM